MKYILSLSALVILGFCFAIFCYFSMSMVAVEYSKTMNPLVISGSLLVVYFIFSSVRNYIKKPIKLTKFC